MKLSLILKCYLLRHSHHLKRKALQVTKRELTVLVASNASGSHKMKLVVVGKSTKPRAFKYICISSLPVVYLRLKKCFNDA